MRKRVELAKVQRDTMLLEAKHKKMMDFQKIRNEEMKEVTELKQAIEQEKQQKLKKKMDERSAAWKVIRENE